MRCGTNDADRCELVLVPADDKLNARLIVSQVMIYGIARVPRGPYFVIDRRRLGYLNGIEKVNCTHGTTGSSITEMPRATDAA
jgi:hypothetical protein